MYTVFNVKRSGTHLAILVGEMGVRFMLSDLRLGTLCHFLQTRDGAVSMILSISQALMDDPSWAIGFTVHSPSSGLDRFVQGQFRSKSDALLSDKSFKTAIFRISEPSPLGGYDGGKMFLIDLRRTEIYRLREFLADYYDNNISA